MRIGIDIPVESEQQYPHTGKPEISFISSITSLVISPRSSAMMGSDLKRLFNTLKKAAPGPLTQRPKPPIFHAPGSAQKPAKPRKMVDP